MLCRFNLVGGMLSRTSRGDLARPLRLATSGLAMTISPWSGNRADFLSHLVDVPVMMEHFKGKSPSSSRTMGSEEEWSGRSTWMILATGFTLPLWKQNDHTNLGRDPPDVAARTILFCELSTEFCELTPPPIPNVMDRPIFEDFHRSKSVLVEKTLNLETRRNKSWQVSQPPCPTSVKRLRGEQFCKSQITKNFLLSSELPTIKLGGLFQ